MNDLKFALHTQSAPHGKDYVSAMNNQYDPEISHHTIEQSLPFNNAVDTAQFACPESIVSAEDSRLRRHMDNAQIDRKMEDLREDRLEDPEAVETMVRQTNPHELHKDVMELGEPLFADVQNHLDMNMDFDVTPARYADSVTATTALNDMLVDVNNPMTSWFDFD